MIVLQTSTLACTIFSAHDGIMTLAGNNGDYSDADTYIVFYPAENGKHGRMYAGWKQFWWQTGMNDQGLFFASASTSFLEVQNSTQKPRPPRYLMYICMEQCSTVEDVLEVFDQYNLDFLETMQLMVSDATGASVIIEGDPHPHQTRLLSSGDQLPTLTNKSTISLLAIQHRCCHVRKHNDHIT